MVDHKDRDRANNRLSNLRLAGTNSVKNTYYTDDGRICRTRQCGFCEWKWWTLQYPESNIDPATTLVRIERWGKSTGSKKQVQIINV